MYEKEIRKVRNEIEDARANLEDLTTEVMTRGSTRLPRPRYEKYFHFILPRRAVETRASNSICIPPLIISAASVNLNYRMRRIPAGNKHNHGILFRILCMTGGFTASRFAVSLLAIKRE